jgi:hypothetical protein
MCDELLKVLRTFDPKFELNFTKLYIGLAKAGQANNIVIFRPLKSSLRVEPQIDASPEIDKIISDAGLDSLPYDKRWGRYRVRVDRESLAKHASVLNDLMRRAYERP